MVKSKSETVFVHRKMVYPCQELRKRSREELEQRKMLANLSRVARRKERPV